MQRGYIARSCFPRPQLLDPQVPKSVNATSSLLLAEPCRQYRLPIPVSRDLTQSALGAVASVNTLLLLSIDDEPVAALARCIEGAEGTGELLFRLYC